MGKHGPCRHCGITSTPLWRNGPPEKPVLCNACGSRWRTKGTLLNYTPLHARLFFEMEENKSLKSKDISDMPRDKNLQKNKHRSIHNENRYEMVECDDKGFDEDTSNRSSSGSASSYAESCARIGVVDVSETTGSAQSNLKNSIIPAHKMISRPKAAHVEKLTRDLNYILQQQSSSFSMSSEDDLIYENATPMGFSEIGHGGVLIRNSKSASAEEESEAISALSENKSTCSGFSFSLNPQSNESSSSNKLKIDNMTQENLRRDNFSNDIFRSLDRDSHLGTMDLKDVVNFEVFTKHLTANEQHKLVKYLPSVDPALPHESIINMFESLHFKETLCNFQQLIREGVFDLSFSFGNQVDCRTLNRLVLVCLSNFKWIEHYNTMKNVKYIHKCGGKKIEKRRLLPPVSPSLKRPRPHNDENQIFREPKKVWVKNPIPSKAVVMNEDIPANSSKLDASELCTKSYSSTNDLLEDNDKSCLLPGNQFALPSETSSIVNPLPFKNDDRSGSCLLPGNQFASPSDTSSIVNPSPFKNDSADQDLLLDVPCNLSFPQAELLSDFWKKTTAPMTRSVHSKVPERIDRS